MSSDFSVSVRSVGKSFRLYGHPFDRLKQLLRNLGVRFLPIKATEYYREHKALQDINFEIKPQETVGIIGKNGSGKSTLLQIICGTLSPTQGQVKVNGRIAALLELGSGFNPDFTGRENLYLNASILGLSREEIVAREEKIIKFADIGIHIDEPVRTYSSGMTVRLAFSIIAHVDADVLIIDEALAVGDAFFTQKCMRFLRSFMENGTVLFVSHDTSAVRSLCNRVIWLDHGKIVADGSPKEICEDYIRAFYESQQGESVKKSETPETQAIDEKRNSPSVLIDQRNDFINASNLRNDIRLVYLELNNQGFGTGDAEIINVELMNTDFQQLAWIVGGERCILRITVLPTRRLVSPIIGFQFKDRFGQVLFGDNTYMTFLDDEIQTQPNSPMVAEFEFQMPRLPAGDYTVGVAVAEGDNHDHVQLHWIHDAIQLRSESTSTVTGLLGIPMLAIRASGTTKPTS